MASLVAAALALAALLIVAVGQAGSPVIVFSGVAQIGQTAFAGAWQPWLFLPRPALSCRGGRACTWPASCFPCFRPRLPARLYGQTLAS